MGSRYIITIRCEQCGKTNNNVPYAPSSGFTDYKCDCGNRIELTMNAEKPMDNILVCEDCGKESDPVTPDICGHCLRCTDHCDNDPAYHQEAQ
jgi:hypothetical protein